MGIMELKLGRLREAALLRIIEAAARQPPKGTTATGRQGGHDVAADTGS